MTDFSDLIVAPEGRFDGIHRTYSPADVEKRYLAYVERMAPKIPEYFSVLPKASYGVKRLDPAAERRWRPTSRCRTVSTR